MSWNLEADIDLQTPEDLIPLLRVFVDVFGTSVLGMACRRVDEHWERHVLDETFTNVEDLVQVVTQQGQEAIAGAGALEISVFLDVTVEGSAYPRPSLQLFGPQHPGRSSRRRADVVLELGNIQAYSGRVQLANGTMLTKEFVMDGLAWLAQEVSPAAILLHTEETVSFPLDYHFVYHHDLAGYVQDLAEIIHLWLYGGAGYTDGRQRYPPVSSDERGNTMMFAQRQGKWLRMTQRFLGVMVPRLEEHGLPATFDRTFMDMALRECDDNLAHFYTGAGGLGVYGVPPMQVYADTLYYRLMRKLLPNVGNAEWSDLMNVPSRRVK